MTAPILDFWFDFASTYSYLAAMRIGPLAEKAEVRVRFRPFLLGPIFKAQGWVTSPFNLYPAKGRNMWRDLERSCAELKLPIPASRSVSAEQPARSAHGTGSARSGMGRKLLPRALPCGVCRRPPHRRSGRCRRRAGPA
jgi:2-hydroxychromene-2-carboxylate isomerase